MNTMSTMNTISTMNTSPTAPLPIDALPRGFRGALRIICYALRELGYRVRRAYEGEYRAKNFPEELTGAMRGEHRPGMQPVVWFGALCDRWDLSAAGGEDARAFSVSLPEGWCRWHVAMAVVRRTHLERIIEDYAAFCATFATTMASADDAALFESIDEPDEVPDPWVPALPSSLIPTGWWYSVWTSLTPMQHGADEKSGNVSRFRMEAMTDLLTGRDVDVPLLSGNAIRGQLRDLLAADLFERVGLDPRQALTTLVHGLFSGGSIAEGNGDAAGADVKARGFWRETIPAISLLGGCYENQVMSGWLRCQDARPVCRETAAAVASHVAPGVDPRDLARRLPLAQDLFVTRQLVRHAHRDLEGAEGAQMLARFESVKAGTQWVHGLSLSGLETSCPSIVKSCLAHALDLLTRVGTVGAGSARGFGGIAFDAYRSSVLGPLPTSEEYLEHLTTQREAIRMALVEGRPGGARGPKAPKLPSAAPKRGKAKAEAAPAEAAPEADQSELEF